MRVLYTPLLKLFTGGGQKSVAPAVVTPQQDAGAERRAAEEADRKARAAALARTGRRSTLLSGGQGFDELDQKPKTLLGATNANAA